MVGQTKASTILKNDNLMNRFLGSYKKEKCTMGDFVNIFSDKRKQ